MQLQEQHIIDAILSIQESKQTLLERLILGKEERQFLENAGVMEAEFIEHLLSLSEEEAEQEIIDATSFSHAIDDLKRNHEHYLAQSKGKSIWQIIDLLKSLLWKKAIATVKTKFGNTKQKTIKIGQMDIKDVPSATWNWSKQQFLNTYNEMVKNMGPAHAAVATAIWFTTMATLPGGFLLAYIFKSFYPMIVKQLTSAMSATR